jgi:hypothetical protein
MQNYFELMRILRFLFACHGLEMSCAISQGVDASIKRTNYSFKLLRILCLCTVGRVDIGILTKGKQIYVLSLAGK